mmetsp:Transcript_5566/g.23603  ORF Transcript_5566/g.23603 Transcript_5566/m.23603 type:complete len:348 (+) Transcript_5566:1699-2742(+)
MGASGCRCRRARCAAATRSARGPACCCNGVRSQRGRRGSHRPRCPWPVRQPGPHGCVGVGGHHVVGGGHRPARVGNQHGPCRLERRQQKSDAPRERAMHPVRLFQLHTEHLGLGLGLRATLRAGSRGSGIGRLDPPRVCRHVRVVAPSLLHRRAQLGKRVSQSGCRGERRCTKQPLSGLDSCGAQRLVGPLLPREGLGHCREPPVIRAQGSVEAVWLVGLRLVKVLRGGNQRCDASTVCASRLVCPSGIGRARSENIGRVRVGFRHRDAAAVSRSAQNPTDAHCVGPGARGKFCGELSGRLELSSQRVQVRVNERLNFGQALVQAFEPFLLLACAIIRGRRSCANPD